MSSLLGGQINPQTPNSWFADAWGVQPGQNIAIPQQQTWAQALTGMSLNGQGQIMGLPGYQGQLSPTSAQTPILNATYSSYNPASAGAPLYQNLGNVQSQLLQNTPTTTSQVGSAISSGGVAGSWPYQLMQNMQMTGNTGGTNYMSSFLNATPYNSRQGQAVA